MVQGTGAVASSSLINLSYLEVKGGHVTNGLQDSWPPVFVDKVEQVKTFDCLDFVVLGAERLFTLPILNSIVELVGRWNPSSMLARKFSYHLVQTGCKYVFVNSSK